MTATPTSLVPATSFHLSDFENGPWLEQEDPNLASALKGLSWVGDGIDELEYRAIENILYIAVESLSLASTVVLLDWVQDGISGAESAAIEGVSYVAYESSPIATKVMSLGWVQDGVDDAEARIIDDFAFVTSQDPGAASRILGMSFLTTIEPHDVSAMESLSWLAIRNTQEFERVLSHPALSNGISDPVAPIIATLHSVAETNPALIDVLLDPNGVVLELRTITLPLSGEVVLTIIRTGPGAARSMDLLEHAVRSAETYMGLPLPANYVGLLYEDAVFGSTEGTYFGTHITILPEYDVDDGTWQATFAGEVIAHEVAHYYWSGNADWIDEGAAELMAAIIEGIRTGRPPGGLAPALRLCRRHCRTGVS